ARSSSVAAAMGTHQWKHGHASMEVGEERNVNDCEGHHDADQASSQYVANIMTGNALTLRDIGYDGPGLVAGFAEMITRGSSTVRHGEESNGLRASRKNPIR